MILDTLKDLFRTSLTSKALIIILIIGIGVNVMGAMRGETTTERFNDIIANSTDAEKVDRLMVNWYSAFNSYQEAGMEISEADHQAMLGALRSYRLSNEKR